MEIVYPSYSIQRCEMLPSPAFLPRVLAAGSDAPLCHVVGNSPSGRMGQATTYGVQPLLERSTIRAARSAVSESLDVSSCVAVAAQPASAGSTQAAVCGQARV